MEPEGLINTEISLNWSKSPNSLVLSMTRVPKEKALASAGANQSAGNPIQSHLIVIKPQSSLRTQGSVPDKFYQLVNSKESMPQFFVTFNSDELVVVGREQARTLRLGVVSALAQARLDLGVVGRFDRINGERFLSPRTLICTQQKFISKAVKTYIDVQDTQSSRAAIKG